MDKKITSYDVLVGMITELLAGIHDGHLQESDIEDIFKWCRELWPDIHETEVKGIAGGVLKLLESGVDWDKFDDCDEEEMVRAPAAVSDSILATRRGWKKSLN